MEWGLDELFALIAILLVLEGLLPASSPETWRKILLKFINYSDNTIRIMGLSCMIIGAITLAVIHNWDAIIASDPTLMASLV